VEAPAAVGEMDDVERWYFSEYGRIVNHREMLEDVIRTQGFRKAIFQMCNDKVVLDIGCGSGILSLFAAQAGARRVIAVEGSPRTAALAKEAARRNGFDDIITVVQGRLEDEATYRQVDELLRPFASSSGGGEVEKPPRVAEVIVSEWMGYMLVFENMYGTFAFARERWLAPSGSVIPASCSVWAAPISGAAIVKDLAGYWCSLPYGLDLGHVAAAALEETFRRPVVEAVEEFRVLAKPRRLWRLDCEVAPATAVCSQRHSFEFEVERKGPMHALAVWFKCGLAPNVGFSTGPTSGDSTHWHQTLLFFGESGAPGEFAPRGQVPPEGMGALPGDRVTGELAWTCEKRNMQVEVQGMLEKGGAGGQARYWGADYNWTLRPDDDPGT